MESQSPKKHIDVVVRYFYPVAAGIETNILETYAVLAEMGWDVTIHTSRDVYEKKNELPADEIVRGLKVKRYEWHWWGCWPAIDWSATTLVALHNFDIFPQALLMAWAGLQRILGQKQYRLVVTPHGGFTPEWSIFPRWVAVIKRAYHFTLGVWLMNMSADGVRAVSEWEKREMIHYGVTPDLVTVISNGLEDEALQNVDALASPEIRAMVEGKTYTLTVSRIHPIKNHETTLKALAQAPASVHHFFMGPVSQGHYKAELEKLIQELGLEQRVHFLGVVRGVDKYYVIKHALAMVHMAKWESFCNVVHEALSQGTPCIVADNTALSMLIHHDKNGWLVETFNETALAEKITWVHEHVQDESVQAMLASNQQKYRVTWRQVAERMHEFYLTTPEVEVVNEATDVKYISWPLLVVMIIALLTVGLSLRGLPGTPSATEINSNEWKIDGPFELSPERGRFALLYSLVEDKSFTFSLAVAQFATPDLGFIDGRYVSLFAPGLSFLLVPGYVLGSMLGYSQVGASAVIGLFALLNVGLIYLLARNLGAQKLPAALAALGFLVATPALAYAVSLYQHHVTTFLLLLGIYLLVRWRTVWSLFFVWFILAACLPVDYPNLFLFFPLGLYALGATLGVSVKDSQLVFTPKPWLLLSVLGIVLPLAFFFWYNDAAYGNPFQLAGTLPQVKTITGVADPNDLQSQRAIEVTKDTDNGKDKQAVTFFETRNLLHGFYVHLMSPDRGVIWYAPIALLGLLGLPILYKGQRQAASLVIFTIGAVVLLYSMWGDPWGGWAFGSRYLIPVYALLMVVLAVGITSASRTLYKYLLVIAFILLFTYGSAVNILGAITTSSNPPQAEVLALEQLSGKVQKYTYERNWDFLQTSTIGSKSFVYGVWGKEVLTPRNYYLLVVELVVVPVVLLSLWLLFSYARR